MKRQIDSRPRSTTTTSTASSVTTDQPYFKWLRRTCYISQLPHYITSYREKMERLIENSINDIEENNEIVRGLKLLKSGKVKGVGLSRRLSRERRLGLEKLGQLRKECEELQEYRIIVPVSAEIEQKSELIQDFTLLSYVSNNKILDYLQAQLNVTFNMRDKDVRSKELGDVLFYYLMRGEKPDEHVQKIILRLHHPLYEHTNSYYNYSWYELCCWVLWNTNTFTQFYKRLDNNKTALEYLLYKRPQLLLNNYVDRLMFRLIEYLSYGDLHQIITNIRDENVQTCMFNIGWPRLYVKLYSNHVHDLYELLSIRNTTGQTALHVHTREITHLLARIYTPKQREAFIKLTSITDNNNRTALKVSDHDELRSLIHQVQNNEYITLGHYTNILIIYNTNNREVAEEEAETIYNACKSEYNMYNITLETNKSRYEIIDLIKHTANERYLSSLIVILMSHGYVGAIDDYHGNPIKLSDIEAAMCSDILDGKPKMLITPCCQIDEKSAERFSYYPTHEDFYAVMSCATGRRSTRGVFIEKLAAHIINRDKERTIFELIFSVIQEMKKDGHEHTSIKTGRLTAQFCHTDSRLPLDELYSQSNCSKLSPEEAITPAKLIPPELTPKKCIKPDEILFYLIDKKIDVEMVRFGKTRESYEIFMNRAQWAGIEEEFHQHFKRDPPLDIVLQRSDDCGVVTELCGYTNSGVSVSIGKERSDGKVSLILLKSERKPFMLMMAHVLRDLKELKRHLGKVVWENMWSPKSGNFSQDAYIAVIDALNRLLDKQDLKIELNYPEQRSNQPNGKDRVTISGTKIVGLVYDVVADQTEADWNERRNRLPPDNLPTAFLACDAALIQLDINSSTIPAMQFQDFDRIRIANKELRRISNIFEVLDLADVTWTRIAQKPLFCADLRLDVQMPPTSEARRAPEFGPRSMWKPRLITEPDDVTSSRLYAEGHSGMTSVRENDDENDRSVSAVGALHSDVRKMRQLYFIPIWHQLRAMKYLPEYDLLVPENEYFLINQDRPIDFSSHITEAQTRIEQPSLASDCRSPDDIDEPETNP